MTLHVWSADDEEWVVAESAEDAARIYCALIGVAPDWSGDGEDSGWGTYPHHWSQLPDDKRLKWGEECAEHHKEGVSCPNACDDGFIIRTNDTCAEHVAKHGRGYMGSANQ